MEAAPLALLLVEDNDGDAFLVEDVLRDAVGDRALHVTRARTLAEALVQVKEQRPDCVLLDLGLPDVSGRVEALERLLAHDPSAAVVVLTGLDDETVAAEAIAVGAQDYVLKRRLLDVDTLARSVRFAARRGERLAALRESNDELGAFAGTVAHDLRGPLAAITGLATLMATPTDMSVEDRVEMATRIADSGRRLASLVGGLLAYAEQTGPEREPVELCEVVEWAASLVSAQLAEAGGSLVVAPGLPSINSNEPALRTVLLNLLGNAVKYRSPDRTLVVEVSSETRPGEVVVTVGDNGLGIPARDRTKVFALHERSAAPEGSDGFGIGLSSVRRIVAQLGGNVWIADGRDGVGVRVRFSLPRGAPADP